MRTTISVSLVILSALLMACANGGLPDDGSGGDVTGEDSGASQSSAEANDAGGFSTYDSGNTPSPDAAPSQAEDASPSLSDASSPTPDASPSPDASAPPDASSPSPDASPLCADPSTPANCHACDAGSCQANGCYGGYLCNTSTNKCHAPGSC